MTKELKHNIIIFVAFLLITILDWQQIISVNTPVIGASAFLMYKYPNNLNRNIFFQLAVMATMVWLFQIY